LIDAASATAFYALLAVCSNSLHSTVQLRANNAISACRSLASDGGSACHCCCLGLNVVLCLAGVVDMASRCQSEHVICVTILRSSACEGLSVCRCGR